MKKENLPADPWWHSRLLWWMEFYPEETVQRFRVSPDNLKGLLNAEVAGALQALKSIKAQNPCLDPMEAQSIIAEMYIHRAPEDYDPDQPEMPDAMWTKILAWAEEIEIAAEGAASR